MDAKVFGKKIQEIRKQHKYSLRKVEQRSGISFAYISKLENGERNVPKPETLKKLAKGIGVSEEEMFKIAGIDTINDKEKHPYWATETDVLELDKFLESNGQMTFKGVDLTKEQKERVNEILTQVFWEELKKDKKLHKDINNGKNE